MGKVKGKTIRFILTTLCGVVFLVCATFFVLSLFEGKKDFAHNTATDEQRAEWEAYAAAEEAANKCYKLFENDSVKDGITKDSLSSCVTELEAGSQTEIGDKVKPLLNEAILYLDFISHAETYYADGIVKSSIAQTDIDQLSTEHSALAETYKAKTQHYLDELNQNLQQINAARSRVSYFVAPNNDVQNNPNRNDYNSIRSAIDSLAQQDVKNELNPKAEKVLQYVEQQEEIARQEAERRRREEEERQRQIAAAWHILDVPYHSQNRNGVNNGCEVTTLLMASQYKGYLTGSSVRDLAEAIPKSDDPNTGFFLDIYGDTPRGGDAHWIAPAPLAEFAREYSGNPNVLDISGTSLADLDREIDAGNPVIMYATNKFVSPNEWTHGAPKNLHVVLLVGYNSITGEQATLNPWIYSDGSYRFTYSFEQTNSVYEAVGRRAVVVR